MVPLVTTTNGTGVLGSGWRGEVAEGGPEAQGGLQAVLQAGKAVAAGLHPLQAQQGVGVLPATSRCVLPKCLRQPAHAPPVRAAC